MSTHLMKPGHITVITAIAVIFGFLTGLGISIYEITANRFIQHETYRLLFFTLQKNLNKFIIHSVLLLVIVLCVLFILNIIWLLFFRSIRKSYAGIVWALLVSFFLIAGWGVNHYCLPNKFHLTSLSFDICLFVFTILLGIILLDYNFGEVVKKAKKLNIIPTALSLTGLAIVLNSAIMVYNKVTYVKMPNIILISIDTLRADHLGCYGYNKNTSLNIDKFSKDAVLFKNCISQAPSTEPSHASILTSLICYHHGAFVNRRTPIAKKIMTMAEFLKNADYKTISFNGGAQVSEALGFGQGFDIYHSFPPGSNFIKSVASGIKWLESNKGKNFFMFLHTYEVHSPYTPQKKYLDLFETDYKGRLPSTISHEILRNIREGVSKIDSADLNHIVNCYNGEIRSMDDAFLILEDYLKAEKIYDNTMIIFTSDHGEEFGERGKVGFHAFTLYDELIKVPLIIKFPAFRFRGKVLDAQVRSIDILPTVLEALGVARVNFKLFDGDSLYRLIDEEKSDTVIYAVSQIDTNENKFSIRTSDWKLYDLKLFDLENDPQEKKDVSAQNGQTVDMLKKQLDYLLFNKRKTDTKQRSISFDQDTSNALRSLGYLN